MCIGGTKHTCFISFIVYELWFKQIRREIDLICNEFQKVTAF